MRFVLSAVLWLFFSVSVASAATFTISSSVYPTGQRDIGIPVGVLDSDTMVEARFTRESWPTCEGSPGFPCNVVEGGVYVSVNGGPQQLRCSFTAEGGDVFLRNGTLATFSGVQCDLPPGTLRTVSISLKTNFQLPTSITVATSP